MRYRVITLCLFSLLPASGIQAQVPVRDDEKKKQWQSMENGPWDFAPDWYYYFLHKDYSGAEMYWKWAGFKSGFRVRFKESKSNIKRIMPTRVISEETQRQKLEKVEEEAKNSAMCTHNHIEGLKAAVATAGLIYLALRGERKKDLKKYFNKEFEYPVNKPLWAYRPKAKFDATAEGTMPLAFRCFMESEDWESCIRNVFSVKCDTDTVACIAGGIAGAYYKRTVENEKDLLKRYLIKPDKRKVGEFDRFLYDWATK